MEVVEHLGVRVPLDRDILSDKIIEKIRDGLYERKEASQLPKILNPGERVLEIGAGIGFISTLCSRNSNPASIRVYEANPFLIPFIKSVHALNDVVNVDVVNAVLLNKPGLEATDFYLRHDFWASSLSPQPYGYREKVSVPVRSFSREIEEFSPTLIICDIEGGELDLFMNSNLTGVKQVHLEVHQPVLGRKGMKALFDAFSARNFHYDQRFSSGGVVHFSHIS